MLVFQSGDRLPDWCELSGFSRTSPAMGMPETHSRSAPKERVLITRGRCQVFTDGQSSVLRAGQFLDIPDLCERWTVLANTSDAEYLSFSGHWGNEVAGCGIWFIDNDPGASNPGDDVDYTKTTCMDSHYHDYDEFWFVLDGEATAVVGASFFQVKAGDCLAIPAGHHHDLPQVQHPMRAAFFETTLLGQQRIGHLWTHTHGPAVPREISPCIGGNSA